MKDRFKFRGQAEKGKWFFGSLLWYAGEPQIWDKDGYNFIVIAGTVGQCTGLKDKNGKLIFEGDIISRGEDRGVIKYDDETASYYIRWKESETFIEDCEVIGNIYENPELLEVNNEHT